MPKSKLEQRIGRHRRSSNANYNPKMHTGKGKSTSAKDIIKLQAERRRKEAQDKRAAAARAGTRVYKSPNYKVRTPIKKKK